MSNRRRALHLLAAVRIINGAIGLVAPQLLIKRFDADRPTSPAAIYAFRLFGIRTILLGVDLLVGSEADVRRAVRQGVVIHVSDLATVVALGLQKKIPPRTAVMTALISGTNVTSALTAMRSEP